MSQLRKKYQVPVPCCLATEFESLLSKNLVKLALMNKIWIQFNKKSFKKLLLVCDDFNIENTFNLIEK